MKLKLKVETRRRACPTACPKLLKGRQRSEGGPARPQHSEGGKLGTQNLELPSKKLSFTKIKFHEIFVDQVKGGFWL